MLQVDNIIFGYSKKDLVLNNISFTLKQGEHLCIMGESGSGKSTLLKLIYGLYDLDFGSISWNNELVLGPQYNLIPSFEKFKYVAQDFNLNLYTSVSENIKKFLSREYPDKAEERCKELLEIFDLNEFKNIKVNYLSGGQQQRVAIARAIANEPELILLDEPFGQIDTFKKNTIRRKLFSYLKRKKITCIVATHDREDSLSFADKLLVLQNKKVVAFGAPKDIYKNLTSKYIGELFNDVNEIETKEGNKKLFYPNQIKIVNNSKHRATVVNTYFKGFYWLIECFYQRKKIILVHPTSIPKGNAIYIDFYKE